MVYPTHAASPVPRSPIPEGSASTASPRPTLPLPFDRRLQERETAIGLLGCAPTPLVLTPPKLEPNNRGTDIACVRSMRIGGPRIEAMQVDDQLVTHAYGFGGAGWTLAPGAVQAALGHYDDALTRFGGSLRHRDVAVVGSGIIGLSLAAKLAQRRDTGTVRIYTAQRQGLASHRAGGLLAPVSLGTDVAADAGLSAIAVDALRAWREQSKEDSPGVRNMYQYRLPGGKSALAPYIAAGVMRPAEHVEVSFGPGRPTYRMERVKTMFLDIPTLMDRAEAQVESHGIEYDVTHLKTLSELDERVVFNCAGLGARELAHDPAVVPVLGHMVSLINQGGVACRQYMLGARVDDGSTYFIPKSAGPHLEGVLGGTYFEGQEDLTAEPGAYDAILTRGRTFFYGHPDPRQKLTTAAV